MKVLRVIMVCCENEVFRFLSLLKYVFGRRVVFEMFVVFFGDMVCEWEGNISLFFDVEIVEI